MTGQSLVRTVACPDTDADAAKSKTAAADKIPLAPSVAEISKPLEEYSWLLLAFDLDAIVPSDELFFFGD